MKKSALISHTRMACVLALAVVAISCSKKAAAPAAVPDTASTATQPSPATPQAPPADTRPIEDASAINARIAAAQAAMKAKDYEQAATALTISRQSVPMSGDQLMTYNSAVASMQSQIAAAAAAGDPKAKAVYEAMRQRASEHR